MIELILTKLIKLYEDLFYICMNFNYYIYIYSYTNFSNYIIIHFFIVLYKSISESILYS